MLARASALEEPSRRPESGRSSVPTPPRAPLPCEPWRPPRKLPRKKRRSARPPSPPRPSAPSSERPGPGSRRRSALSPRAAGDLRRFHRSQHRRHAAGGAAPRVDTREARQRDLRQEHPLERGRAVARSAAEAPRHRGGRVVRAPQRLSLQEPARGPGRGRGSEAGRHRRAPALLRGRQRGSSARGGHRAGDGAGGSD